MNSRSIKTIAMAALLLFAVEFHIGVSVTTALGAEDGGRIIDTIISIDIDRNLEIIANDDQRLIGRKRPSGYASEYEDEAMIPRMRGYASQYEDAAMIVKMREDAAMRARMREDGVARGERSYDREDEDNDHDEL